jgi:hypothetical protein
MRLKRTALFAVAAAALAAALGTSPAGAADKPGPAGIAGSDKAVAADAVAMRNVPEVSAAVSQASVAVKSSIEDFVATHGTKYSFGAYLDRNLGRTIIQTDAPAEVVSSLVGTYASMVEIRTETVTDTFSRKSDTPPFWGGAGITFSVGTPHCTSGYTVQNASATRFMVTAGHCFDNGETAFTELGGLTVGVASGNALSLGKDMVLLGGQSYGTHIYTGGVDDSVNAHIASAGDPVVGFNDYCTSGRTTGANCGHTDLDNNATVCTQTGCKSPVVAYTGGVLPAGGDSGGPFYVGSIGAPDMHIRGHHIASGGTTRYAEMFSRVANQYGVTIVT